MGHPCGLCSAAHRAAERRGDQGVPRHGVSSVHPARAPGRPRVHGRGSAPDARRVEVARAYSTQQTTAGRGASGRLLPCPRYSQDKASDDRPGPGSSERRRAAARPGSVRHLDTPGCVQVNGRRDPRWGTVTSCAIRDPFRPSVTRPLAFRDLSRFSLRPPPAGPATDAGPTSAGPGRIGIRGTRGGKSGRLGP